jgi:hypothetical protein
MYNLLSSPTVYPFLPPPEITLSARSIADNRLVIHFQRAVVVLFDTKTSELRTTEYDVGSTISSDKADMRSSRVFRMTLSCVRKWIEELTSAFSLETKWLLQVGAVA